MIKVENGQIHIKGSRTELGTEFMELAETLLKKGVFTSKNELLASIHFVCADKDKQRDIVVQMLDDMIKFYEGVKGD